MTSGIQSVFSSQQYCVFGKVASLEMVFVRSGSTHDEGCFSHLKSQLLVVGMLFVVPAVLFDILKARQLACVSKSGQKCPAAQSLSSRRAWIEIFPAA